MKYNEFLSFFIHFIEDTHISMNIFLLFSGVPAIPKVNPVFCGPPYINSYEYMHLFRCYIRQNTYPV